MFKEVPIDALREAIRNLHGCDSHFVESVPVVERAHINHADPLKAGWRVIWEGAVCVFDLIGHPTAKRVYAWSAEVPGMEGRRFMAVLHAPPIDSPIGAVRAAIISDLRSGQFDWGDLKD